MVSKTSLGLEPVEDALEGVVRWDTVGQFQEAAQPVEAFASEGHDLLPVLSPSDDRAQGDDEDVLQVVQAAVGSPWVLEFGKEGGYRQVGLQLRKLGKVGHRSPPGSDRFRKNRMARPLTKSTGREEYGQSVERSPWDL